MKSKKSTWNYRVIEKDGVYNIHEVYYTGKIPNSWSQDPIYPQGMGLLELHEDMAFMMKALSAPVLQIKNGKILAK